MYGRFDVGIHPREPLQDLLQASRNHCSSLEDHIQHLSKVGDGWLGSAARPHTFSSTAIGFVTQRLAALKSHVTSLGGNGGGGGGSAGAGDVTPAKGVSYNDVLDK